MTHPVEAPVALVTTTILVAELASLMDSVPEPPVAANL
jgi:hypothetical protein